MEFKKGDNIKIGKDSFDVLDIRKNEFDKFIPKKEEFVGLHTRIELHEFKSNKIFSTHILKIYNDNPKKAKLFKMNFKNPLKDFPNRKLSVWREDISNEKEVDVKDISKRAG